MKKYMSFILFSFLLLLTVVGFASAKENKLKDKVILIDPGHGNLDPGTVVGDIYEKDINLKISLKLKEELEKQGAKVILTRDGDYDLAYPNASYRKKSDFDNRIKLINNSHGDLYLSIHLNYLANSKYYGPQVFYDKDNEKLAKLVQQTLNKELQTNREVKKIPSSTYMYDKLKVPGILIECGFLSNPNERDLLQTGSYQDKIAKAITKALEKHFT